MSDAFIEPQENPACEIKVKFANIGGSDGKNLPVVQNCAIMKEYCEFMEIVTRHRAALGTYPPDDELIECYDKAISEAISKGILVDYLSRKTTEVRNMFVGEYDYDMDMKIKKEEAREEKAEEDARSFYANGASIELIAKSLHMTEEQVKEIVAAQPAPAN